MKALIIIIITLTAAASLTLVMAYIWIFASNGTNLTFQSSDRQWADSEILFKGRDFQSIVVYFHLYKLKCNKPHVTLERITKKPEWYTLENLFNNYQKPKWKIPLGAPSERTISGYYPKVTATHCYNKSTSMQTFKMAKLQSKEFIENLKESHDTVLNLTSPDGA